MPHPGVVVIDYHTGNSQSVSYALDSLKIRHRVERSPDKVTDVSHIILPGVGTAGTTMEYLREDGWLPFLTEKVIESKLPFLGICIGMQILFEHSEEQNATCLGWFPGEVRPFDRSHVRVPHMGWNRVATHSSHPFVSGFSVDQFFYFVNSYYAIPGIQALVAGVTEYDGPFTAIVARKNIMGTQFHIEKSGPVGLSLLNRFVHLSKEDLR